MRDENAEIEGIWKSSHFVGAALALLLFWVLLAYGVVQLSPHKLTVIKTGGTTMLILEK